MPSNEYINLQNRFEILLEMTAKLLRKSQSLNNKNLESRLQEVWFRLQQGPIRVLVLGTTSAGKSTLINASVGEIVTPEGLETTSPLPVWICPCGTEDDSNFVDFIWRNSKTYHENVESGIGVIPLPVYISNFCYKPNVTDKNSQQYDSFEAIKIRTKNKCFGGHSFTFVDTPGINADGIDTSRTMRTIGRGYEMIVFVSADNINDDNKDAEFLKELLGSKNSEFLMKSFFVIHNPKDILGGEGQETGFNESVMRLLGSDFDENRISEINLLHARFGAINGPYKYLDHFPVGSSPQQRQYYADLQSYENSNFENYSKNKDKDPAYNEIQKLLSAIDERATELCGDPEAILTPIYNELNECCRALMLEELNRNNSLKKKELIQNNARIVPVPENMQKHLNQLLEEKKQSENVLTQTEGELSVVSAWLTEAENKHTATTDSINIACSSSEIALRDIIIKANTEDKRLNIFAQKPEERSVNVNINQKTSQLLCQDGWSKELIPLTIRQFGDYISNTLCLLRNKAQADHNDALALLQEESGFYKQLAQQAGVAYADKDVMYGDKSKLINPNEIFKAFPALLPESMLSQIHNQAQPLQDYWEQLSATLKSDGLWATFKKLYIKNNIANDTYKKLFSKLFSDYLLDRVKYYNDTVAPYAGYRRCGEEIYSRIKDSVGQLRYKLNINKNAVESEISEQNKKIAAYRAEIKAKQTEITNLAAAAIENEYKAAADAITNDYTEIKEKIS